MHVMCLACGALAAHAPGRGEDEPFFRRVESAPGYIGGNPWGISADGRVVVGDAGVEGGFLRWHAYRWRIGGEMQILGSLYEDWNSTSFAASSDGSAVVGDGLIAGGTHGAFRWTAQDGLIHLGDLSGGSDSSAARGVSADGEVVVGFSSVGENITHAFRWTRDTGLVDLGVLPNGWTSHAHAISADGLVVVGSSRNSDYKNEAFRWTEAEGMVGMGDLAGGSFSSIAYAINVDGSVAVGWGSADAGPEAFRWTESGGIVGLGFLAGTDSVAYAVSADGSVVVGAAADPRNRPFIWTAREGMRNLQEIIEHELGLGLFDFDELIAATGVSADGRTIVGWGYTRDGQPQGWVAYLGPGCRVDFDDDGVVDTRDVIAFLGAWSRRSLLADWNYDAVVDIRDVVGFLNGWVEGC
jgi:probable HAF family extracellular repeat protein